MLKRNISAAQLEKMIESDIELIEDYPDDQPYPSRLVLGHMGSRPIHAVLAFRPDNSIIVVTVYEPDLQVWDPSFRERL